MDVYLRRHFSTILVQLLFFLTFLGSAFSGTEVLRPRGVPLIKAALYDSSKPFSCFDGSNRVPFLYVNDDYCDCHDSSDEPGTAACAQGRFHCINRGFRSVDIPSSRVNDGICDCCDGTDEYDNKVGCQNTCMELGKQMREEAERQLETLKAGYKRRQELIESVKSRKDEKAAALASIEAQVQDLEAQKDQYTKAKEAAESVENAAKEKHRNAWDAFKKERDEQRDKTAAEEAFKYFSQDQKPFAADTLAAKLVKDGETLAEDLQEFVKTLTNVDLESFVGTVWPKIKDTFKNLQSSDAPVSPTPAPTEASADEDEHHDDKNHDHTLDPYDEDDEREEEEPVSSSTPVLLDEDRMPDYDAPTRELIATAEKARKEYTEFDLKLFKANEEKTMLKKWLENDYGPDSVFAALEGNCLEFSDREYTYKMCPFDKVTQKSKDGGSDTGLGKWGNWEEGHKIMHYTDGARCWNGPARSTKVHLICGSENELISAAEPNRCEYQMTFRTPTVCTEPAQNASVNMGVHDEL